MKMKTKMQVTYPDSVELTLTMTMDLGTWKKLKKQLSDEYPAWDLGCQIREMIDHANAHFYPDDSA